MLKRLFDIVVSLVVFLVTLPLMLLIGLLIKIDSRGPVIFKQQRVGLGGEPFQFYKFRSMVEDAASRGPYYTSSKDPRITRMGRFLRKTSLDELPQLFNVLKGEMSIVGPRPDLPIQKDNYSLEDWMLRNTVRPGITGLAQVNGRSNSTFENRLHHDLKYAKTHNLMLDVAIILKTIQVVLLGKYLN